MTSSSAGSALSYNKLCNREDFAHDDFTSRSEGVDLGR
jgi:hypothetical protein